MTEEIYAIPDVGEWIKLGNLKDVKMLSKGLWFRKKYGLACYWKHQDKPTYIYHSSEWQIRKAYRDLKDYLEQVKKS